MIHQERFYSRCLGVETYVLIALPEGAEPPLPAVVLLRGAGEEWLDPNEDASRRGRHLLGVQADLTAKGFCAPLAFILPRTTNQSKSCYVSHGSALRPDLIEDPSFLGRAAMDAFFDEELLGQCFATGWVRPDAVSIDGFSLGGASAIAHALRRPDLYRSCGSFDGAFLEYEHDHPGIFPETPSDLRFDAFPYLFGFPPDERAFREQNPLDIVRRGGAEALPPAMIHYSAAANPSSNGWRVRAFLEAAAIDNHAARPLLHEASEHTWWWVDEHLYRSLPFHAHFLYSGRPGDGP